MYLRSRTWGPKGIVGVFAIVGALALGASSASGAESREIRRYDVKVKNSDWSAGAARARVAASKEVVRSVVTDYQRYASIITRFKSARVVGRVGDKTDVYLQVPILKGAANIWAIVRFDPPTTEGGDEVVRGRMVKGNVKRLDAVWRIRQAEAGAELDLELLIVPDLPAPRSIVLGEVRSAAARALYGARAEAERRGRPAG
jgi:hypothetical protein